jgi:DNA-binding transcriptional LysR family regulator
MGPCGGLRRTDIDTYRKDEIVLAVPVRHGLASQTSAQFDDVLPYDFVGLPEGTAVARLMQCLGDERGALLRTRIRVASFASMLAMIAADVGIGLVPRGVVEGFADSFAIKAVALRDAWASRNMGLCSRRTTPLGALASELVTFLQKLPVV